MKRTSIATVALSLALGATFISPSFAQPNPERNAYFGETHIHTSWSVDAWVMGNRVTGPADAYNYAKGQPIKHPMGYEIRIETPMDFMGVTDHSEYVGVTKQANTPGSYMSTLPEAKPMIMNDPNSKEEQNRVFSYLLKLAGSAPVKAFMNPKVTDSVWAETCKLADEANEPGKFTAFRSYEWTSMPGNRNLHRNIFFRGDKVPASPFSALDSKDPTELWKWMDGQRKAGNELLAISHNANVSDGWMYPIDVDNTTGRPIDAAWAESRMRNERLIEIKQGKGQSEAHPLLSPNDEFAGYEMYEAILGLPADVGRVDRITGSYARQALKDGLAMQDTKGFNPYKFGMAGGSDSHNTGSPYRQENFYGLHADADGNLERRFAGVLIGGTMDVRLENPGGLTGAWAEENTRASIFDAMYRKETFGVSGPHIKVRFFGGWDYEKTILAGGDWVKQSYAGGVPMGADLPAMPTGGKGAAPKFVVWAVKDPTSGNLDRLQIIKGWTKNGQSFEKVFDVAWAGDRTPDKWSGRVPAIQSTVNIEKATYENSVGATELKTVWSDPEFDASLHAFYYARVLEIPTPRWTLIQAVKAGIPPPDTTPLTGQERAWSSPIWYAPSAEARKNAATGTTVADLKKKGASSLGNSQLKDLVVGKAFWLRNNVTGEQFSQNFTEEVRMIVFRVGASADMPSGFGNVVRDGYQGTTSSYKIEGGKLITWVSQDPYAWTFHKLGTNYYAARNNEFGFANYEIIPAPQIAANPLTAIANQFSTELSLTQQQKEKIVPILTDEIKQLGTLKTNTALSGLKKIEELRSVGVSFDQQVNPLLNAEQQAKFQALRAALRRRVLEKIASGAEAKVEGAAETHVENMKQDLEALKAKLEKAWF